MPRFVVAEREEAQEESSSEEEQSEEEDEDGEDEQEGEEDAANAARAGADAARLQSNGQAGPSGSSANGGPRGKLKIQLGGAKGKGLVCHVRAPGFA